MLEEGEKADTTHELLAGWGMIRRQRCDVYRPASPAEGVRMVRHAPTTIIARGLGRAYGDSAINEQGAVVEQRGLGCFIAFDADTGLLECEAGVSLADIIEVFLPRGWFLPTTPGTKYVTIGGAIAADIHGKNHHRVGSFGGFVEDLRLLLASGEIVRCSRHEHAELFFATLGGMGLTGVIITARVRLVRVPSGFVAVDYTKTTSLDETFAVFERGDATHEHSVAWVDCLARGQTLGRGIVMQGNWADVAALAPRLRGAPFALPRKRRLRVPFVPPVTPLSRFTVYGFNACFYLKHANGRKVIDCDTFFYPLDAIDHWNRLYGSRGFVQYQAFFPRDTSRAGLRELLARIAEAGAASFLAVLKSCGEADGGLLSYLEPGHTLALDMPYHPRTTPALCRDLDAILLKHGGRLYLAKDALTDAATLRSMYPRLPEFQRIKKQVDPECRFSSSQARRLGIVP